MNPPPLPSKLKQIIGKPLDKARKLAEDNGYRLEVLIPITEKDAWGEEQETGWVLVPSPYDSQKINVQLDDNGEVVSINY